MGMELERDGDYRIRAVRRSRKSVLASSAAPSSALSPSPSSTFRSFFGRKNSATTTGSLPVSQQQHSPSMPSPALTSSSLTMENTPESAALSPSLSTHSTMNALGQSQYQPQTQTQSQPQPQPFFGGKADLGGEVKFTVEVVKVRGLTGLYSLEVKRIKGTLSDWRENHVSIPLLHLTPLLHS